MAPKTSGRNDLASCKTLGFFPTCKLRETVVKRGDADHLRTALRKGRALRALRTRQWP